MCCVLCVCSSQEQRQRTNRTLATNARVLFAAVSLLHANEATVLLWRTWRAHAAKTNRIYRRASERAKKRKQVSELTRRLQCEARTSKKRTTSRRRRRRKTKKIKKCFGAIAKRQSSFARRLDHMSPHSNPQIGSRPQGAPTETKKPIKKMMKQQHQAPQDRYRHRPLKSHIGATMMTKSAACETSEASAMMSATRAKKLSQRRTRQRRRRRDISMCNNNGNSNSKTSGGNLICFVAATILAALCLSTQTSGALKSGNSNEALQHQQASHNNTQAMSLSTAQAADQRVSHFFAG